VWYIIKPINPIDTGKKFINYWDFEKLINRTLNKMATLYTDNFKGVNHPLVKKTFWDLVDGKLIADPYNWYVRLAYIAGRVVTYDILYQKRKIEKETRQLRNQWFRYIFTRVMKFEPLISNEFFATLYSHFPVVDRDAMLSLYEEMIRISEKDKLKQTLDDPNIDSFDKIIEFKKFFIRYYEIFLGRCEYIGIELGKHEDKNYGNDLRKIFQLRPKDNNGNITADGNDRSPPRLCDNVLDMFIHIRNALSHSGKCVIVQRKNNNVRFSDYNMGGVCTFDKTFTFHELWIITYWVIIMDREFETMSLTFAAVRQIRDANKTYCTYVKCHICGKMDYYYIPPNKTHIICRKCRTKHSITSFK